MTKLDMPHLIEAGIHPTQAKLFIEPLKAACELHDINTPRRLAAFIGQCAHETGGFVQLEENLRYTSAERIRDIFKSSVPNVAMAATFVRQPERLANKVYANRGGNGNEASGDGWRYRGRGLIGTTFRRNYAAAQAATGRPYIERPELLATPSDAALAAAVYWRDNQCNTWADAWELDIITRLINKGMAGRLDRIARSEQALEAFS